MRNWVGSLWVGCLLGGWFASLPAFASLPELNLSCAQLMSGNYSLIVYPHASGGKKIAREFSRHGELAPVYIFDSRREGSSFGNYLEPDQYIGGIRTRGDHEETIRILKQLPQMPRVILAGDEEAVDLVDEIREALKHPYANDFSLSRARYHKGLMGDVLRGAGINHVSQFYSSEVDDLLNWQQKVHRKFPVVVKPVDSAGSDGVRVCYSESDIVAHFNLLKGSTNACNRVVTEILIQETLDVAENEFVVDIVARDGAFKVFVAGKYLREQVPGGGFIVTGGEVIDSQDSQFAPLFEYAFSVARTLGWRNGPAHMEIVKTPGGYKILDFNGRVAGTWPSVGELSSGENLFKWLRHSVLDPKAFAALPVFPAFNQPAAFYTVRARETGRVYSHKHRDVLEQELISKVGSVRVYSQLKQPGAALRPPKSVEDLGAIIELSHPNRSELDSDMRKLRQLDADGFFTVIAR